MICLNCGKHVDDGVRVCPYCGCVVENEEEEALRPAQVRPSAANSAQAAEIEPLRAGAEPLVTPVSEPVKAPAAKGSSLPGLIVSAASLILSLLCVIMLFATRAELRSLNESLTRSVNELSTGVGATNERLDRLDVTLAGVQAEAYNQVASQSISITKDLTPLTGPVDEGKYNRMFIVTAKGNLNVDTSFDWQRYNKETGNWVSIVFTGDATTNEQYGLRLENQFDGALNEYTTILWAQGITPEAEGTYRCVITDQSGITKTSAEAIVTVQAATDDTDGE